ncbi:hypothetical protein D3C81_1714000 [compost metagenome]
MQQGERIALTIQLGTPCHLESHMLIEAECLRVLLIHIQFMRGHDIDGIPDERLASALAATVGGDEKHFNLAVQCAYETKDFSLFIAICAQSHQR